jgi:hypothetical protein
MQSKSKEVKAVRWCLVILAVPVFIVVAFFSYGILFWVVNMLLYALTGEVYGTYYI